MYFSLMLFLIGILGFVLNRKNIILMLISIEIMILSITFLILISSLNYDDILGQTFAIYIITIAGTESAIGLGILVAFYRFISSKISYCKSYNNTTNIITFNNISNVHNKINKNNKSNYYLLCILSNLNYGILGVINYFKSSCFNTDLLEAEGSFVITIKNKDLNSNGKGLEKIL